MNKFNIEQEIKALRDEGFIEGELSIDPLWYQLLVPENIKQYNIDYEVAKYAPGFTAFGSNGGGELLVVDNLGVIYTIPAIGMEPQYADKIANSFKDLRKYMK